MTSLFLVCCSAESHENPFQTDGELSKKADFIVRNSKISRTELRIADPDKKQKTADVSADVTHDDAAVNSPLIEEQCVVAASAPSAYAAPDVVDGDSAQRPSDVKLSQGNGNASGDVTTPQSVEVEVESAQAQQPRAQQAEEVNLDKKRGKCCVVQ